MEISTKQRFTFIDGLRGIAAISVMFYHFYSQLTKKGAVHLLPEPLHSYFLHGDYGVQIFFVLSGFVIAFSVWKEGINIGYIGNFALRRSLRLDPPYWVVIIFSYIALRFSKSVIDGSTIKIANAWEFILNLFYLDNLTGAQSIVAVGWTLQIEVQFYLTFILILFVNQQLIRFLTKSNDWWWLTFIPLFLWAVLIQYGFAQNITSGLFLPYWSMFFIGAVSFWTIDKRVSYVWIIGFVSVMLLANVVGNFDLGSIVAILTVAAILLAAYYDKLYTWLSNPIIQYLGVRSYSIYLIHPLIGNRIVRFFVRKYPDAARDGTWQAVVAFLVASVLSLIAAELLYQIIEKNSIKFAKRFRPKQQVQ